MIGCSNASGSHHHSVSGIFPETSGSDLPWSHKSKCTKTRFRGPDHPRQVHLREAACRFPGAICCFQNVFLKVQENSSFPASLQQPLQTLKQAPANSPPYGDTEPAPLPDFSVEPAESVLPSEAFLPASTPQTPVCMAASCSCKALWFSWPTLHRTHLILVTMQAMRLQAEMEKSSCHLIHHVPRAERSILVHLRSGKMSTGCVFC